MERGLTEQTTEIQKRLHKLLNNHVPPLSSVNNLSKLELKTLKSGICKLKVKNNSFICISLCSVLPPAGHRLYCGQLSSGRPDGRCSMLVAAGYFSDTLLPWKPRVCK